MRRTELAGVLVHHPSAEPLRPAELVPAAAEGPPAGPLLARAQRDFGAVSVGLAGALSLPAELRRALGAAEDDLALVHAAYLRWGADALSRLSGAAALVIIDREARRTVLFRDAQGLVPLYLHRDGRRTAFSTHAGHLARRVGATADADALCAWVTSGLWPDPRRTRWREVEAVPAGHALLVEDSGRARDHTAWSFVPHAVPRGLGLAEAQAELRALLRRLLPAPGARLLAEGTVGERLADWLELSPADLAYGPEPPTAVRAVMDGMGWPLGHYARERLHRYTRSAGALLHPLGADQALGATPGALLAYLGGLARQYVGQPSARSLGRLLARGLPAGRAGAVPLAPLFRASTEAVLSRWSARLPAPLAARVPAAWAQPAGLAPLAAPHSGDPFTDRRFDEVRDPVLLAEGSALAALAAGSGRALALPFLEPEVLELLFALPPEHFITRDRLALLTGGARQLRVPPPLPPAAREAAAAQARALALPLEEDHAERLAGLAAAG